MIKKEFQDNRRGLWISVGGDISEHKDKCDEQNNHLDVMIGAMLESLHGGLSDATWADVVRHLRNDGVCFKIYDER